MAKREILLVQAWIHAWIQWMACLRQPSHGVHPVDGMSETAISGGGPPEGVQNDPKMTPFLTHFWVKNGGNLGESGVQKWVQNGVILTPF